MAAVASQFREKHRAIYLLWVSSPLLQEHLLYVWFTWYWLSLASCWFPRTSLNTDMNSLNKIRQWLGRNPLHGSWKEQWLQTGLDSTHWRKSIWGLCGSECSLSVLRQTRGENHHNGKITESPQWFSDSVVFSIVVIFPTDIVENSFSINFSPMTSFSRLQMKHGQKGPKTQITKWFSFLG